MRPSWLNDGGVLREPAVRPARVPHERGFRISLDAVRRSTSFWRFALPGPRLTAVLLLLVIALVLVALFRFTAEGPRFRAADYPTLAECLRAIPPQWARGSLERERAERACQHQERERRR